MNKSKIVWIVILVAIVAAVVAVLVTAEPAKNEVAGANPAETKKINTESAKKETTVKETVVTKLDDGTLYSLTSEKVKADKVVGDNFFDTQITDMMLNPNSYKNKNIEIEGMYLTNDPFTFVGRYSTSSMCPTCPAGYSYMEYEWEGEPIELKDEETWIKVIGTLEVGNDETSGFQDYYYLKASSIEVMNERGQDTVNN